MKMISSESGSAMYDDDEDIVAVGVIVGACITTVSDTYRYAKAENLVVAVANEAGDGGLILP